MLDVVEKGCRDMRSPHCVASRTCNSTPRPAPHEGSLSCCTLSHGRRRMLRLLLLRNSPRHFVSWNAGTRSMGASPLVAPHCFTASASDCIVPSCAEFVYLAEWQGRDQIFSSPYFNYTYDPSLISYLGQPNGAQLVLHCPPVWALASHVLAHCVSLPLLSPARRDRIHWLPRARGDRDVPNGHV